MRNIKAFPCTVQYFNTENGVCRKILDFYEDPDETLHGIFDCIKKIIENNNFSLRKISAYSADNTAVNYGIHNSVFTKLQKQVKHAVKANCKCHFINNSHKKATTL